MPNNYLSVLYQHIIQVENKNVGLKVEGHKHTIAPPPPVKKVGGGTCPLAPPPPRFLRQCHSSVAVLSSLSSSVCFPRGRKLVEVTRGQGIGWVRQFLKPSLSKPPVQPVPCEQLHCCEATGVWKEGRKCFI